MLYTKRIGTTRKSNWSDHRDRRRMDASASSRAAIGRIGCFSGEATVKANSGLALAAMMGGLNVAGCGMHYRHAEPRAAGTNAIGCTTGVDDVAKPNRVFILHIPGTICSDISTHKLSCGAASCVWSASPNAMGDNDNLNGIVSSGKNEARSWFTSAENWRTPLDIDLDPNHDGANWKNGQPILIKIVLDDPNDSFFHPRSPTTPDWRYALFQGNEGKGMFRCPQSPRPETQKAGRVFVTRWFMTVKVFESNSSTPGYGQPSHYGGLNIGILRYIGSSSSGVYLPLYIDPMIHNNG